MSGSRLLLVAFGVAVLAVAADWFVSSTTAPSQDRKAPPTRAAHGEESRPTRSAQRASRPDLGRPDGPTEAASAPAEPTVCIAPSDDDPRTETSVWTACPPGWDRSYSIRGRVVDADGEPVRHADLRFWSRNSLKHSTTDAEGRFVLTTDVEEATYDVDVLARSRFSWRRSDPRIHAGTVRVGDGTVELRTSARRFVVAEGVLVDERDTPLADCVVEARYGSDNDVHALTATTDGDGRFRVLSWTAKPLRHLAVSTGGARRPIAIPRAGGGDRILVPTGITGRVVASDGGSAIGAIVRVREVGSGVERVVPTTDAGNFSVEHLRRDETYELTAELAGFACPQRDVCHADSDDVVLHLIPPGFIEGRALDASGDAAGTIWLRFVAVDSGAAVQTMTNSDGSFRANGLRPGPYDVVPLVPGENGRLVPGTALTRCVADSTDLELRLPR